MDSIRSGRSIYMRHEENGAVRVAADEAPGKQCDELKWQQTRQTSGSSGGGGSGSSSSGSTGSGGGEQTGRSGYTAQNRSEDKRTNNGKQPQQVRANLFSPTTMHFADQQREKHVQREFNRTDDDANNKWQAAPHNGTGLSLNINGNKNLTLDQNLEHPAQRPSTLLSNDNNIYDSHQRPRVLPSQDFYYSDSQHYLESTLPLNYRQQQQRSHPFGNTYELTQMQKHLGHRELPTANGQQEDTDAHLYCAVTNMPHPQQQQSTNDRLLSQTYGLPPPPLPAGASTLTTGRNGVAGAGQLNHHYQIPNQILRLSAQQQQHQPYSIYKSPTSMTLNRSYQTLVEKLNENRTSTSQHHQFHHHQQPVYSNNGQQTYSNHPAAAVAAYFHGYHQTAAHQQVTTSSASPIFSSITTTNTTSAAPIGPITPTERDRDRHLEKYKTNAGFRMGHAHRQLKWAFTRPNCWCRLLLLLLMSILLLVGIFIVSLLTRTTNTFGSPNRASQSQLANIPNGLGGGGGGPNEFPLSRFQMNSPLNNNENKLFGLDSPSLFYPGHAYQPLPPSGTSGGDPLLPVTRTLGPNAGPHSQLPNNVINREQNNLAASPADQQQQQLMKWPTNLAVLTTSTTAAATTTTTSDNEQSESRQEASTQSYWSGARNSRLNDDHDDDESNFCSLTTNQCNGNGKCDASRATCSCAPGYSGPTCLHVDCPNECSHRGECKLRADWPLNNLDAHRLESFGFQSLSSRHWQVSTCSDPSELQVGRNRTTGTAARLEWSCECRPGFTGPDCGQLKELQCQDGQDNDLDGLADCEDDDCCSQPICRDNLMCYKPPEPSRMLEKLRGQEERRWPASLNEPMSLHEPSGKSSLFAQWSFLIANGSVQSYAQEKSFARDRVAIVRGRTLNGGGSPTTSGGGGGGGIASVRVSVLESAAIGFTLTRSDGHFDMLVNGDEWLTLQFMRVAYAPVKRRIFVRAQSINVLDDDVLMWLSSASAASTSGNGNEHIAADLQQRQQSTKQLPYALALGFDLAKMIDQFRQRDDERRRAQLFECLFADLVAQSGTSSSRNGQSGDNVRPTIAASGMESGAQQQQPLRMFALVSQSSSAFITSLRVDELTTATSDENLELIYNSAHFPAASSIVKPTVSIGLLPDTFSNQNNDDEKNRLRKLIAINLQLDIEGQTRRERLETVTPGLSYQFAWNRRNVYGQKIYGFSELNVRVSYEYELASSVLDDQHLASGGGGGGSRPACLDEPTWMRREFRQALAKLRQTSARTRTLTYEGRVYMEAHQMNQHADLGKWGLAAHSRYDEERNVLHFGTGWMLPFKLVYPSMVSKPIELALQQHQQQQHNQRQQSPEIVQRPSTTSGGRLLARGPHSSIFVAHASRLVQLDSSGTRRLLDVPLSILASKFTPQSGPLASDSMQQHYQRDMELLYNNFESALYISSRSAARIVRVSLSSLIVLNRTLATTSATLAPEDEIDIELLCGPDQQQQQQQQPLGAYQMRACKSVRLLGPHSLALDEQNQMLYFVDGTSALMALNLNTNSVLNLSALPNERTSSGANDNKQQQRAWAKVNQANNETRPSNNQNNCLGLASKLTLADLASAQSRIHSLAWNKADSSLYFVIEQRAIVALRQDLSLEIVALGAATTVADESQQVPVGSSSLSFDLRLVEQQQQQQHAKYMQTRTSANSSSSAGLPLCSQGRAHTQQQLHAIEDIQLDESSGCELIILHKWPAHYWRDTRHSGETKLADRFYLAKLHLGIRSASTGQQEQRRVFDLHSAQSTWDELVLMLARDHHKHATQSAPQTIDWKRIAPHEPHSNYTGLLSLISSGFERVDSIQLNSAGTIFLFDATHQTLRLIEAYSPSRMNLIDQHDSDVSRFFGYPAQAAGVDPNLAVSPVRNNQLSLVQQRNPIEPSELLEFHSDSGLLLRRTLDQSKLEFYYTTLQANNNNNNNNNDNDNNKLYKAMSKLDEDDEYDLQVHRFVRTKFAANKASLSPYIRLGYIFDMQTNRNYEFVRDRHNQLKSILLEGRATCEMSTDHTGVLTTFVHQPSTRTSWTELVYNPKTYLLHNVIAKSSSQLSVIKQTTFPYDDKLKRLTRRILYDEMFNHHCDLFTVDA